MTVKLWTRWLCFVVGHRFTYKHARVPNSVLFGLFYLGTPAWYEYTAIHCSRCGLESTDGR